MHPSIVLYTKCINLKRSSELGLSQTPLANECAPHLRVRGWGSPNWEKKLSTLHYPVVLYIKADKQGGAFLYGCPQPVNMRKLLVQYFLFYQSGCEILICRYIYEHWPIPAMKNDRWMEYLCFASPGFWTWYLSAPLISTSAPGCSIYSCYQTPEHFST